jgi:hypothetical protein
VPLTTTITTSQLRSSLSINSRIATSRAVAAAALVFSVALVLFEVLPIITLAITPSMAVTAVRTFSVLTNTAMTKVTKQPKALQYGIKYSDEHHIAAVGISSGVGGIFASYNNDDKKFVHSSIRIEEQVLKALQREAERRGVSFNSLVNKTLKNYVISEMYFEQLGFILVSKDFLRKTFSRLNEKDIEEFGRELGLTVAKEYISYFFPQVNNATLVEFLDIWFRRFQFYQHRVQEEAAAQEESDVNVNATLPPHFSSSIAPEPKADFNQKQLKKQQLHLFTISHDINMNFSLVLKAILEGLVEPITKSPVIFKDITATSIRFSIKI